MTGRDGGTLSQYWADGMRTLHGIDVRGFPNLLFVQPTQGANLISNVPHNIVDSAQTIAAIVRHAVDGGFGTVEPSRQAEDAWVELLLSGPGSMIGGPDCTPGYYNNEGQDAGRSSAAATPTAPAPTSPTSTSGAPPAPSTAWSSGPDGELRESLLV